MVAESGFDNCLRYTNFHQESDMVRFAKMTGLRILDMDFYNERSIFKDYNRDLDFIVTTFSK